MRNSAETRMRGYLDHTRRELLSEQLPANSPQHEAVLYFKKELSKSRYGRIMKCVILNDRNKNKFSNIQSK